jgi:hypothetical protein
LFEGEGEAVDHAGLAECGGGDGGEAFEGLGELGGAGVLLELKGGVGGGEEEALEVDSRGEGLAGLGASDDFVEEADGVGGAAGGELLLGLGEEVDEGDLGYLGSEGKAGEQKGGQGEGEVARAAGEAWVAGRRHAVVL